jgi:DNA-binding beta-propeller fold protein YncE
MRPAFLILALVASPLSADVFVSGFSSGGVYRFDESTGAPVGSGVFIAPGSGGLNLPHGILRRSDGTFLVASAGNDRVLRYSAEGQFIEVFIANDTAGVPAATLDYPVDLVIGPDQHLYITSQLNDRIVRFDSNSGAFLGIFAQGGSMAGPSGISFHPNGDLYVANRFSNNVLRYRGVDGALVEGFTAVGLAQPFGLAVRPDDGVLHVATGNANQILQLDATTGVSLGSISGGGLSFPIGVEFGPEGHLFAASFGNNKIARFDSSTGAALGDYITAGATGLQAPNYFLFAVPEPATAGTFGAALFWLAACRRRARPSVSARKDIMAASE